MSVISLKTGMVLLPKVSVGRVGLLAAHPEAEVLCALVRDNRGWIVYSWDLRRYSLLWSFYLYPVITMVHKKITNKSIQSMSRNKLKLHSMKIDK